MGTKKLPESYKVPWDREKVRSRNPDDWEEYFKKTAKFHKNVQTEVGIKHNRLVDAFEDHSARHIKDGDDEIDGDKLDIDWNPGNYTPGTAPSEVSDADHLTAHLEGIDTALGTKASATQNCRIKTGTYTGDGTTSQGITGVGFRPKYVKIWERETVNGTNIRPMEATDTIVDDNASGGTILHEGAGGHEFAINRIISLDSDGFTVDDAGSDWVPNKNGEVYNYMCLG